MEDAWALVFGVRLPWLPWLLGRMGRPPSRHPLAGLGAHGLWAPVMSSDSTCWAPSLGMRLAFLGC